MPAGFQVVPLLENFRLRQLSIPLLPELPGGQGEQTKGLSLRHPANAFHDTDAMVRRFFGLDLRWEVCVGGQFGLLVFCSSSSRRCLSSSSS